MVHYRWKPFDTWLTWHRLSYLEDDAELKHHVTAPATCESLLDYLEAFDYIRPLLQTKEALTIAAYDVAKQAALENVIYIEVRFAPELSMDKGLTVAETIDAVCQGLTSSSRRIWYCS